MIIRNYLEVLLITLVFQRTSVTAHEVKLYTSRNFQGLHTTIEINKETNCVNLPQDFINTVQSTNLTKCTQFYDQPNCTGTSIQLSWLSHFRRELQMWNFHNRTKSLGTCQDSCIPDLGQSLPTNSTVSIILYSLPFFQGKALPIEINGCTPFQINEEDTFETYKSIYIPKGQCVLAFQHQWYTNESSIPEGCIVKDDEVLEFRDGVPHLYYLSEWPNYTHMLALRAFSPCRCKSFTDSKTLGILDVTPEEKFTVLFSGVDYKGTSIKILHNSSYSPEDSCTDVEVEFVNKTVSIGSTNICLRVYDQPGCTGNSILLTPRSPYKYDLRGWSFEKRIQSLKICKETCIPRETNILMNAKVTDRVLTPINITFQLDIVMKQYSLQIFGCTPVDFGEDKIMAIQIPEGECILAFLGDFMDDEENEDPCSVEKSHNILQLWHGLPALDNLWEWYSKSNERIKAFSPCKCNYVPYPVLPDHLNNSYITLFKEKHFRGESVNVSLNFTECKDFVDDDELKDWEGYARSIKMGNESCIMLYKDHDCEGSSKKLNTSLPDLSEIDFDLAIRSIGICPPIDSNTGNGNNTSDQLSESRATSLSYYLIPVGFIILIVCVALAVSLVYIRRRVRMMRENMPGLLSESEILEFLEGLRHERTFATDKMSSAAGNGKDDGANEESELEELSSEVLAQNQPYNNALEILRTHLEFDANCPIGTGEYGLVFKGTLHREFETLVVAIKTAKPFSGARYLRVLLKEVKVMMYVGQHSNIVALIGCCTGNLRAGELFIVMEYCGNSSLEKYLRKHRNEFIASLFNESFCDSESNSNPDYVCYLQSNKEYVEEISKRESEVKKEYTTENFNENQLFSWCIEIAQGMEYLASKKVIHGDLSARNILLSGITAKISDFGLSRKLYAYEEYIRNGEEALPWRWLAIESLKKMEFSTASDVWSYGILLWEIFTLGEQPYPEIPFWTNSFLIDLEQGLRPSTPPFATADCYKIMSTCWNENPQRRPSFSSLISELQVIGNGLL